jgi:hypothetical protein
MEPRLLKCRRSKGTFFYAFLTKHRQMKQINEILNITKPTESSVGLFLQMVPEAGVEPARPVRVAGF